MYTKIVTELKVEQKWDKWSNKYFHVILKNYKTDFTTKIAYLLIDLVKTIYVYS